MVYSDVKVNVTIVCIHITVTMVRRVLSKVIIFFFFFFFLFFFFFFDKTIRYSDYYKTCNIGKKTYIIMIVKRHNYTLKKHRKH